jgi:hypothetical protein
MNASRPLYDILKRCGWKHINMYHRKRKFPYLAVNKVLLMTIFEDTVIRRIKKWK